MTTKTKSPKKASTPKATTVVAAAPKKVYEDKSYKLKRMIAPLSFILASKNTKRKPLLYFDEQEGVNKPLRYARNQKSPFEDEQDGNAILEPIIFEDGFLFVSRANQVLQEFLHYHPENGYTFEEVNKERDAQEELDDLNAELDALDEARKLDIERLEQIGRVVLGAKVDKMSTAELKRDTLVYARNNPMEFLDVLNDPMLQLQSKVAAFFEVALLITRNKKDVYFNTSSNKEKMLTVPFGENRDYIVASWLQSDDGIEALKLLENLYEQQK